MHYTQYDTGQYLFDRVLNGIFIAIKILFKGIVYFPLLFTGYTFAGKVSTKQDNGIVWIALIILFAFTLYLFIFFLKGMLIAFKRRANLIWIPLFLFCVSYTSIAPLWLAFETIEKWMFHISKENSFALTWLICLAFGYYLYSRYHFLSDYAPVLALPVYRTGISLGLLLSKM